MTPPHDTSVSLDSRSGPDEPLARVRGPGDLVAAVPVLLGFHPERSLVLVALGPTGRVVLTARADLPETDEGWRGVAGQLRLGAARAGASSAVLVLFSDDEGPAQPAQRIVARGLRRDDVTVLDVLRVHEGRFYGVACSDPSCCPPEGTPVPVATAVQALAVVEGRQVRGERSDLAAEIAEPTLFAAVAGRQAVERAIEQVLDGSRDVPVDGMASLLDEAVAQVAGDGLSLDTAALLTVLVREGERRDAVYRHLTAGSVPDHRSVWAAVCRLVPHPLAVVPLLLFALAAYLDGDGAVANVAAERAEAWQPDHPTLRLFNDIVTHAIPPARVIAVLAHAVSPDG